MPDDVLSALIQRDSWAGMVITRGTLPRVPQRATLPTASDATVGQLVRIPGATGAADATYECKKGSDDAYSWVQIDGGISGPLGSLGYALMTTSQNGVGVEDITDLTVSVTVGTSRLIRISTLFRYTNTAQIEPAIMEGATELWHADLSANTFGLAYAAVLVSGATAGSHTYKVSNLFGSGTFNVVASSNGPNYILVEDIGAAP